MTSEPTPSPGPDLQLVTLEGCSLAIGRYPRFHYNAAGGGGLAQRLPTPATPVGIDPCQPLQFTPGLLRIPPLDWRSGRFLGLPLPPGVAVTIQPERLDGQLDRQTGHLRLRFQARFQLRLGPTYRAPDLWIDTELSTGLAQGQRHRATGEPLSAEGEGVLVGVAPVAPSGEIWLDRFLGLPDEALAVLRCRLLWR